MNIQTFSLVAGASPVPAWKLDFWVTHAIVPGEGIGSAERLLVGAEIAAHFLLSCVVYRILVASKIVGPREDSIARLPGAWIDALALVRSGLAVDKGRSHALASGVWSSRHTQSVRLSVSLPLVLL